MEDVKFEARVSAGRGDRVCVGRAMRGACERERLEVWVWRGGSIKFALITL